MIEVSDYPKGKLFDDGLLKKIRDRFEHITIDPINKKKRLFFENAGGSFRLKKAAERFAFVDSIPDCPERIHDTAQYLTDIMNKGKKDLEMMLHAGGGAVITELTASQVNFHMTEVITENIEGSNIVTTDLEHPSAFDACQFYAKKTGKELRVAKTNPVTGGVDVREITKLVDENTCLLSVIYASNISGAVLNIGEIVRETRKIKPDLYIIVDAVQHVPHDVIDLEQLDIDGISFAPYKFFSCRGIGLGYISDRVARLPHRKLCGKEDTSWELGSPVPAHFAALSEIVDYVTWIGKQYINGSGKRLLFVEGMNRIRLHERALMNTLLHGKDTVLGMMDMDRVNVYFQTGSYEDKDLILAISIDGINTSDLVDEYKKRNVLIYERVNSSIYSRRMLNSFGLKGCVRISPLHCHSEEEVLSFLEITRNIISTL